MIAAGDPRLGDYGPAMRLSILTGCRREEVSALAWSESTSRPARSPCRAPGPRPASRDRSPCPTPPSSLCAPGREPTIPSSSAPPVGNQRLADRQGEARRLEWRPRLGSSRPSAGHCVGLRTARRAIGRERSRLGPHRVEGRDRRHVRHTHEREAAAALARWAIEVTRIVEGAEPGANVIALR